jgi:hypothetical protein
MFWADPEGHVLVMQLAVEDTVPPAEFKEYEQRVEAELEPRPLPGNEGKPGDWGRLADGRIVLIDYGYICHTEEAVTKARADLQAAYDRLAARPAGGLAAPPANTGGTTRN